MRQNEHNSLVNEIVRREYKIYTVEYKNIYELIELLSTTTDCGKVSKLKLYTDYDITLLYDNNEKIIGAFTDDLDFANTVRFLCKYFKKRQNIFTPSIRCVIIKYKDYCSNISLNELINRYSIKI